jgi:NAD(P)-dependent dehydrogenase (short-subunit alcohol dehydrogenase family)
MPLASGGGVFITGAAAGIGAATARLLAADGYTVYAGVHRDAGALDGLPGVRPVPVDVTDPGSVAAAARLVAGQTGGAGLHAVINNAGVIVQGPLELTPPADLERQLAVNALGPAYVTREFLPLLRAGHGRVVNISAPTARVHFPFLAALSASKAALCALSDALRLELAPWRIPVIVVEPGATDTRIFAKAEAGARAALEAAAPGQTALYQVQQAAVAAVQARQRTATAESVARVIVKAVTARSPRRHYTAGLDARLAGVLAALPAALRDRALLGFLGLRGAAVPIQSSRTESGASGTVR